MADKLNEAMIDIFVAALAHMEADKAFGLLIGLIAVTCHHCEIDLKVAHGLLDERYKNFKETIDDPRENPRHYS